jgi:hypothetical protein
VIDPATLAAQMRRDPEQTVALLADMAVATDPALRAQARRLAGRLLPPLARVGAPGRRGTRRLVTHRGSLAGDLDLDRTLERSEGRRPDRADRIVARSWGAAPRAVCLLVDRSGSMTGRAVALAAVAAAAVVQAASDRLRTSVIAFAAEPLVLRDLGSEVPSDRVVDDLLSLRGHGVTDLARALRAASAQLEQVAPGGRVAVLMSDCLHTRGGEPSGPAGAFELGPRSHGVAMAASWPRPTWRSWPAICARSWSDCGQVVLCNAFTSADRSRRGRRHVTDVDQRVEPVPDATGLCGRGLDPERQPSRGCPVGGELGGGNATAPAMQRRQDAQQRVVGVVAELDRERQRELICSCFRF